MKFLAPHRFLILALAAISLAAGTSNESSLREGGATEVEEMDLTENNSSYDKENTALALPSQAEETRFNLRSRRLQGCASFQTGKYFHITARHSGLALRVLGGSKANGANIVQWPVNKDTADNWRFQQTNSGYYAIVNQNSGQAVNVLSNSDKDGAQIAQKPITTSNNDDWCFQDTGGDNGYYFIIARHSGKALDVAGLSTKTGGNIHQWAKHSGYNQQWLVTAVDSTAVRSICKQVTTGGYAYHITARHSGMAVSVRGASKDNAARIVQIPLNDNQPRTSDNWSLQPTTNGYYTVVNENSGQALHVAGGGGNNGDYVVQWPISDQYTNDDWCFQDTGDGYYLMQARHSFKFMDVSGARLDSGAPLHQWTLNNNPNQHWKLTPVTSVMPRSASCEAMPIGDAYHFVARHSGKALNLNYGNRGNGVNILQWPESTGARNDNWRLAPTTNNHYRIINEVTSAGVSVAGRSTADGANVEQREGNPDEAGSDQWCFQDAGSGYYFIVARHSGKVLEVAGGSTENSANIQQATKVASAQRQQWKLKRLPDKSPRWDGPYDLNIVPAAAANLPDGRVVLWSALARTTYEGGNGKTQITIFDPDTLTASDALIANTQHDMFCPGTAVLPDGEILITGGKNSRATTTYNPATDVWSKGADMKIPRGYHSMTVLANGNVLTIGGSWSGGRGYKHGEVFDVTSRSWRRLNGIVSTGSLLTNDAKGVYRSDNHMWLFTAPGGKVFHAGPSKRMHWINTSGNGSVKESIFRGNDNDAMNGNAVMYDTGKILTLGGSADYDKGEASNRSYIVDINNENNVRVQQSGNMIYRRSLCSSVVLPTGHVVVLGGMPMTYIFSDFAAILMAEMWDPATGRFTEIGNMDIPRTYHSVAILLKDGRVLAAGGGLCTNCNVNHPDAEILTPPYLLNANGSVKTRPVIRNAPDKVAVGDKFTVRMNTSGRHTFAMVRTGAVTHSVNNDNRRISLRATNKGGTNFELTVPNRAGVALPGNYYLFGMNSAGVPSIAATISVNSVRNNLRQANLNKTIKNAHTKTSPSLVLAVRPMLHFF